jgi:hypothetical protein
MPSHKEHIWLHRSLVDVLFKAREGVPLYCNNEAAVSLCRNHMVTEEGAEEANRF